MAMTFSLFAQEEQAETDTAFVSVDTLLFNRVEPPQPMRVSSSAIDRQVRYSAAGQVRRDFVNQLTILTDKAVISYGDVEIKADSIIFNMATNSLFAIGRKDSTGNVIGSPFFKEGSNEFNTDVLTYNFKTKQAIVKNIVTTQGEGLIRSTYAKLLDDETFNISLSTYSTCDADPPHFYINIPIGRVYPGEKMITGPANLVVAGIPLPLIIPFGFFPINTAHSSSGVVFPSFGQERERGYSLKGMGYYVSINDYMDLNLSGDIFTNGTWLINATSNYLKLYKYSGNFSFNYANNVTGQNGLPNHRQAYNYGIRWSFNQDAKAAPGRRFSASVDMSSSNYHKQNSYDVVDHVNTTRSSSINYSKTWAGTPFNLSVSMNQSQNVKNKTVDVNLPKVSFNVNRIYPFKGKATGRTKWYQELQFQYTANLDNRINTYDSLLFTPQTLNNMKNGFKHDIPLSIPLKPFKNFNISPSLTYSGVMYAQKIEKRWDDISQKVVKDTINGVYYGHIIRPTLSAGYNTQIFGMFASKNENARVQAVRHVITPSIGFSFTPDYFGSNNLWKTVQSAPADSLGRFKTETYSIFDGGIYGTPTPAPAPSMRSGSRKSGSISIGLNNLVEAKVLPKGDTTGTPKKVKLIDNLNLSANYNIFADSMRWSFSPISTRTTLFETINVNATGRFSLYALDTLGRPYNKFYLTTSGKPLRFEGLRSSVDFSLDRLLKKSSGGGRSIGTNTALSSAKAGLGEAQHDHDDDYDDGYGQFEMPWTMNVSYNLTYNKQRSKNNITQTMSMVGSVTITKNMTANITTGYDFDRKQITMTQVGIQRDLHCWTMSFSWVPAGSMQMWSFNIRAKASILKDLKYDRRKDFHDRY